MLAALTRVFKIRTLLDEKRALKNAVPLSNTLGSDNVRVSKALIVLN